MKSLCLLDYSAFSCCQPKIHWVLGAQGGGENYLLFGLKPYRRGKSKYLPKFSFSFDPQKASYADDLYVDFSYLGKTREYLLK